MRNQNRARQARAGWRFVASLVLVASVSLGISRLHAQITRATGGGGGAPSGSLTPSADLTYDLGSASFRYNNLWVGTVNATSIPGFVPTSTAVNAGGDLTGGGALSSNQTITLPNSLSAKTFSSGGSSSTAPITLNQTHAATSGNLLVDFQRGSASKHLFYLDGGDKLVYAAQSGAGGFIMNSASANGILTVDDSCGACMQFTTANKIAIDGANITMTSGSTVALKTGAAGALGLYTATPTAQGAVGTTLVNNVTAGGTTGTIADFSDLTLYSNSAATIRNNIYQLALKVATLEAKLKLLGAVKD